MKIYPTLLLVLIIIITSSCSNKHDENNTPALTGLHTGAEQMDLYLPALEGKKVGLVVNHTTLVGDTHLVDTLLSRGIDIAVAFAPEHGFRGEIDAGQQVESGVDRDTGLQITSLYGSSKKPTPEDLAGLDVVIFDIQDVGTRFYTYISTMHYVMEACAENNVPFMVLDRPNPNGDYIDGPVREEGFESFVGMHPIPVVHALTVGELAKMINGEGWLPGGLTCKLTVIPLANYSHSDEYRPPVKTSPNLPNYNSVRWYPTTCFFEGTVISEGRGTYNPFELIGYPDPDLGNFSFTPDSIRGMSSYPKFRGETCWGVDLRKESPERKIHVGLIMDFYEKFKEKDKFFKLYFNTLAGTETLRQQIEEGLSEAEIRNSWQEDLSTYKVIRSKYLLYPD